MRTSISRLGQAILRIAKPKPPDHVPPPPGGGIHAGSTAAAVAIQGIERALSSDELFRNWIDGAQNLMPDTARESSRQQQLPQWLRQRPALFIGIGAAGEQVLQSMANYLQGRCGHGWNARVQHVRLLHIGVSEEADARELGTTQRLYQHPLGYSSLVLNLGDEKKKRFLWHEGIRWFGGSSERNRLSKPGRATGRLAVFADLARGKSESKLWSALTGAVGSLKSLSVYLIADAFSDEASGMAADVAHLLRVSRPNQIGRMALCLAMQNADWDDNLSASRRNERAFATLRELQRLQRTTPVEWCYAPGLGQPELVEATGGPLLDEIMLFDGKGEDRHDVSERPAQDGLLSFLAGSLIALLNQETSQRFYELWANQATQAVRRGQVPLEAVVGSMGAYALRVPIDEMRQLIEARLVHKLLFDRDSGLIPWEELDDSGKPARRGDIPGLTVGAQDVDRFLQSRGWSREAAPRLKDEDVRLHVCAYLEEKINDVHIAAAGPLHPLKRTFSIRWGHRFVVELGQAFPTWKPALDKLERALREWTSAVGSESVGYNGIAHNVKQRVGTAETGSSFGSILGVGTGAVPARRAEPGSGVDAQRNGGVGYNGGKLYDAWQALWQEARQVFERAGRLHAQRLFLEPGQEAELFRQYIAPRQPWAQMRQRIWWRFVDRGHSAQLCLMVLPADLGAPDPRDRQRTLRESIGLNWAAFAHTADKPEPLIVALLDMAQSQSRDLAVRSLQQDIGQNAAGLASELLENSATLCRWHELGADEWPIPLESFQFFAGPDLAGVKAIAGVIKTALKDREAFNELKTAGDETECRLLQVRHVLPIRGMDVYAMGISSYGNAPKADLHVFAEEQLVAVWEEKAAQKLSAQLRNRSIQRGGSGIVFSPRLVELLAHKEAAMRLFGRALVYGVLELSANTLRVVESTVADEDLEKLKQLPFGRAAEHFALLVERSGDLARHLESAITASRPKDYATRIALLDKLRDDAVVPFSERESVDAQDAALLLAAILAEEERAG